MAPEDRADELITVALAALDPLADSGNREAKIASGILRGLHSLGRPTIPDGKALAEIEHLRALGRGREAIGIVAKRMASSPKDIAAIERRLRRKVKKMKRT
jgi:hypothetical protein